MPTNPELYYDSSQDTGWDKFRRGVAGVTEKTRPGSVLGLIGSMLGAARTPGDVKQQATQKQLAAAYAASEAQKQRMENIKETNQIFDLQARYPYGASPANFKTLVPPLLAPEGGVEIVPEGEVRPVSQGQLADAMNNNVLQYINQLYPSPSIRQAPAQFARAGATASEQQAEKVAALTNRQNVTASALTNRQNVDAAATDNANKVKAAELKNQQDKDAEALRVKNAMALATQKWINTQRKQEVPSDKTIANYVEALKEPEINKDLINLLEDKYPKLKQFVKETQAQGQGFLSKLFKVPQASGSTMLDLINRDESATTDKAEVDLSQYDNQ